ncbi:1,4-alpha-glucan branching protein GlgB [Terrilactibacillus sp. BCM23-1]|uniref:1,4-alpha-glucan branching enzyme GlgB n=1 Tax=Terrilactibacillus tamarindi TaxID=2599694 RepID=A0A6N8CMN0_9BACI|nr:1,4-alpha-glucan branching protein GlgB [Terrilactibacillus tamarindi]MTT31292.1 1,4-alpha-glucan branching protein GlgB [Terrilactibacillus tamarindi]
MSQLLENKQDILPSEEDIYLFHEGTLYEGYKLFGAQVITDQDILGVRFTVWAPNAKHVSVVGDFNQWNGINHRMTNVHSGIWTLFIPNLVEGDIYKYEIVTPTNQTILKADPYAFFSELRPNTASVVYSLDHYEWHDQKWIRDRKKYDSYHSTMLTYECHLGSWKKKDNGEFYSYREDADQMIDYVLKHGFTHIEIMPVMEHPYDRSWGYQITGYFSVTSRYGKPEDFMYFIDQCHQKGIGVILDWVPLHFCKDAHGLGQFDGTALYEPEDPMRSERPLWGTYNFDFHKPEVVSFLISNAIFWMDKYHIDGFRIDAVSYLIYLNHDHTLPSALKNKYGGDENLEGIAFIKQLNEVVFKNYPHALMIAEEATDWPLVSYPTDKGGLGFNYKWNMGWVNDLLRYMQLDTQDRRHHHNMLTFSMYYAFSENYILPFSHDELVYGKRSLLNKMPGDYWQKFANLRLLYAYFLTHPGKKLIFMGSEFAQFDEWKDIAQLDWNLLNFESHHKFNQFFITINHFYQKMPCLWKLDHISEGFEWIDPHNNEQSIIIFIRRGKRKGDYCIVLCNFTETVYHNFRIGVPSFGKYLEVFNTDLEEFGGSGQYNAESIRVEKEPYHNQPYSMEVTVPPLGVSIFMKQTKRRRREDFIYDK